MVFFLLFGPPVQVKEPLLQQRKYFDAKTWLHQQVLPHLADMVDDDQALGFRGQGLGFRV